METGGLGNTLPKKERLSGKADISNLMKNGKWGCCSGLRYCFLNSTGHDVNRIMVSVPKKHFKRAVKRNLLKRRIRESYRTQKGILPTTGGTDILFFYDTKDVLEYSRIYELVGQILSQIR